ncbi:MAG: ABC transporter permease subunit [Verrucomicrobiales bacterium]
MNTSRTNRPLNPRRIFVLGVNTFTQLVRMKVFYFLGLFSIIAIAANFLDQPTNTTPETAGIGLLYAIKNTSIGLMSMFSLVLAIVATGLLLPKDAEDRTLYTILAKPVPRLDYLLGKLLGVLSLILISLLVMDVLMTGLLTFRTEQVVAQQHMMAEQLGYSAEMTRSMEQETRALGPTWNLQRALLLVFLRAAVMAAVALLLSTFSTSTLFTAIVGFLVLFLGFFVADAREFYFAGSGLFDKIGSACMSIALPDLQLFNAVDAVIEGTMLSVSSLAKITAVATFYITLYVFASWMIFARKEF